MGCKEPIRFKHFVIDTKSKIIYFRWSVWCCIHCTCTRTRTTNTNSIAWKTDGGRYKPICRIHESVWLRIVSQYFESNIKNETFLFVSCEIVNLRIWTESSTPLLQLIGWVVGQFLMAQLLLVMWWGTLTLRMPEIVQNGQILRPNQSWELKSGHKYDRQKRFNSYALMNRLQFQQQLFWNLYWLDRLFKKRR